MPAHLEIRGSASSPYVALDEDRVTVGHGDGNDVALTDRRVSRLHAVLERYPGGWTIRDIGSRNGTFVNGARIWGDRPLRDLDEIRIGATTLVFRSTERAEPGFTTEGPARAPDITRREREVLIALCRPLASGDVFTEPGSIREIAASLVITEGAVKQHLANLYDKFDIREGEGSRRVRLANEALHSGVVRLADIKAGRSAQ